MKPIKFSSIEKKVREALKEKLKQCSMTDESFSLVEGFVIMGIFEKIPNKLNISGNVIPCVVLIGNNTGKVHTFTLHSILPNYKEAIKVEE